MSLSDPIAPPPQQFSTLDGTIQGLIDGSNAYFTLGVTVRRGRVFRNGVQLTLNNDCVFNGRYILFLPGATPQPGDVITAHAYIA